MTTAGDVPVRLGRIRDTLRRDGWRATIRQIWSRRGAHLFVFYYVREALATTVDPAQTELPSGYKLVECGERELAEIERMADQPGATYSRQTIRDYLRRGATCIGVVHGATLVGSTWYSLDATHSKLHPAIMRPNEAYLCNMYVDPAWRGHNVAGALRYQVYQRLNALGRDTFYSITIRSNRQSWRFKQKLGARKLTLELSFSILGSFHWNVVLRRY